MQESEGESVCDAGMVQLVRAFSDPIIAFDPDSIPREGARVREAVFEARLQQAYECDGEGRIELATWPEVAIYFLTATLRDANWAMGSSGKMYRYAFARVAEEWFSEEVKEEALGVAGDVELMDVEKVKLGKLRRELKRKRDELFLENRYEESGTEVPKVFWECGPVVGKKEDVECIEA